MDIKLVKCSRGSHHRESVCDDSPDDDHCDIFLQPDVPFVVETNLGLQLDPCGHGHDEIDPREKKKIWLL